MNDVAKSPSKRKPLMIGAIIIFVVLSLAYYIWHNVLNDHIQSTDNAYVNGNLVQITPQITGTVLAINADDTALVKAGDPVIQLDPTDAILALDQAQANLAQVVRKTRTLYVQNNTYDAQINVSAANVRQAQTQLTQAQTNYGRRQKIGLAGGISAEELSNSLAAVNSAKASLAQAQAALAASKAQLQSSKALTIGTKIAEHPDVKQAIEAVRTAWVNKTRTVIPAPVDGMVAQRTVQIGQSVSAGSTLMRVVPMDKLWIDANFKEVQITNIKPGQTAEITADVYGDDVKFHGVVAGAEAGTGSVFSLLPAQNASGNWIKVVQRVPVRIYLDPAELAKHPLRLGLSMNVSVNTDEEPDLNRLKAFSDKISTNVFTQSDDEFNALIQKIIEQNS